MYHGISQVSQERDQAADEIRKNPGQENIQPQYFEEENHLKLNTELQARVISEQDTAMADFVQTHRAQLFVHPQDADQFALLEDRTLWDENKAPTGSVIQDIVPTRGSLVIFDSVLLPHQVERIVRGRRVALAGWFHEPTQAIPSFEA